MINEKLEDSKDRYRYVVQNSPDIIYTLDGDSRFTFVNNSVKRILSIENSQLVGKNDTHLIYDDDLEKAKWTFNERIAGDRAMSWIELRLKSFRGDEQFVTSDMKNTSPVGAIEVHRYVCRTAIWSNVNLSWRAWCDQRYQLHKAS